MAWQTLSYQLTSVCPQIMHSGQTADPTNKWSKAIKAISGKKNKTDADYEELARLEFLAGLYMGPNGPIIPPTNVDAMVINAAKKLKQGQIAKPNMFCLEQSDLQYDGPHTAEGLLLDERFRFVSIVRVGQARVVRTRPVFNEWSAVVKINIENTAVNTAQVDQWMTIAGTQIGLGDWRPKYGRFSVQRI